LLRLLRSFTFVTLLLLLRCWLRWLLHVVLLPPRTFHVTFVVTRYGCSVCGLRCGCGCPLVTVYVWIAGYVALVVVTRLRLVVPCVVPVAFVVDLRLLLLRYGLRCYVGFILIPLLPRLRLWLPHFVTVCHLRLIYVTLRFTLICLLVCVVGC